MFHVKKFLCGLASARTTGLFILVETRFLAREHALLAGEHA
jgi:hypothetical protein